MPYLPVFHLANPCRTEARQPALLQLRPLQGTTHQPASFGDTMCHLHQRLPWSPLPLRRLSPGESTYPRFTSPGTFRPQDFSPSRRFTPRRDLQPYFRLVTPVGFCPSGVYPLPGPVAHHHRVTLLTFAPLRPPRTAGIEAASRSPWLPMRLFRVFRVLLRQRIRTAAPTNCRQKRPIPSWALILSRVSL